MKISLDKYGPTSDKQMAHKNYIFVTGGAELIFLFIFSL